MEINIIGLGKMGLNLAQNLIDNGISVRGFDLDKTSSSKLAEMGGVSYESIETLLKKRTTSDLQIVWLMLPSGKITNQTIETVISFLGKNDIIIDGGNSKYTDTQQNSKKSEKHGIHFFDVGTSGGVSGARNGACMMIGGTKEIFDSKLEPFFKKICVEDGYLYCGESGSGHYLKMIHNGIEYGMMQSIGEGFNILHHSDFNYDLEKVAKVFNHGSVIRSWLMELTENLLSNDPKLSTIEGTIPSSGEGKWTIEEMLRLELSAPVLTQSLLTRYSSMDEEKYGEKIIASLRNQFGGHEINKKEIKK
ncbi:phosphogluconate dehydrogenase (NAD(+)-dependent, decarboxylating) [Vagococcus fluvialis]|uniref:Decarboxylating 6-phosphogluconate dehydrogenase n=1 Tax=Vagococcus fluvialis TaxID=2738 RepID=A0A7X6I3A5_9ENTE|nr:decarboxylating 6-phosphogluconate dehydrogenase [Vagococcus fluvialis]NKC68241.1 decarboxylating 6-phosphogluconate dehydrogenase [Vagococcus fluvialis]